MPFACTILDKWAKIYLKIEGDIEDYKYMTMCAETNEEHRWRIKAGTHPQDGTCRPQVLMFEDNRSYYQLIERFGERTGIYSLLNTSLNIHGMPIASTLDDAIDVLIKGKLDGLLVGDSIMISKKDKNS